jgi:hypothetical protein
MKLNLSRSNTVFTLSVIKWLLVGLKNFNWNNWVQKSKASVPETVQYCSTVLAAGRPEHLPTLQQRRLLYAAVQAMCLSGRGCTH